MRVYVPWSLFMNLSTHCLLRELIHLHPYFFEQTKSQSQTNRNNKHKMIYNQGKKQFDQEKKHSSFFLVSRINQVYTKLIIHANYIHVSLSYWTVQRPKHQLRQNNSMTKTNINYTNELTNIMYIDIKSKQLTSSITCYDMSLSLTLLLHRKPYKLFRMQTTFNKENCKSRVRN